MSAAPAPAQISPELFLTEFSAASSNVWWNPLGARRCGRWLCTKVLLHGDRKGITIAAPVFQDGEEQLVTLEERSRQLQASFRRLVRETLRETDLTPTSPVPLWSPYWPAQRHPQTPRLAVGGENGETVIYLPKQFDLAQRTLVTVTGFDLKQNQGFNKRLLAEQWQSKLEQLLSRALWGQQYDLAHPWGRPLAVVGIILSCGIIMAILGILNRWAKVLEQKLRQRQKQLRGAVQLIDPEMASVAELNAATEAVNRAATLQAEQSIHKNSSQRKSAQRKSAAAAMPESLSAQRKSAAAAMPESLGHAIAQQAASGSTEQTSSKSPQPIDVETLPIRALRHQTLLKRQRTLIQLGLRFLFWLQFSAVWLGLTLTALVYPTLRPYAAAFLSQTIALPLIWMVVNLVDKCSDLLSDRWFEQWAKRGQEFDPQSQRYALRAETYSIAVRGLTTIGFTILGLYATVRLFGINPAVLASAGFFGAALVLVARGVLQDMLNGALVLATDRYAVGDVIAVGDVTGLVEAMNLYITQVRATGGRLVTIPNGQIQTVENLTKDWSRVEFEVAIAYETDVSKAFKVLEQVSEQLASEPEWKDKILEAPSILGLEQVSHEGLALKVWIKTQPLQQWSVEREFRLRVKLAFDRAEIAIGIPQQRLC